MEAEDIGSAEEAPNHQRGTIRASTTLRDVSPSRTRDPEGGRYADILHLVYELNEDISPPAPRVDDTFGGKLFSRYQGNTTEETTPAPPLSGVMANAARHVTGVVAGVNAEEGRAKNSQKLIRDSQHGFTQRRSCLTNLIKFLEERCRLR